MLQRLLDNASLSGSPTFNIRVALSLEHQLEELIHEILPDFDVQPP
jgi:hypothetical protein